MIRQNKWRRVLGMLTDWGRWVNIVVALQVAGFYTGTYDSWKLIFILYESKVSTSI